MSDPNINPYYDHTPCQPNQDSDAPAAVPDSGMPMPVGAFFVGIALFAIAVLGSAVRTATEATPAQGQLHAAAPVQQSQPQPPQQLQTAPAQQSQAVSATSGSAPKQQ